MMRNTGGSTPLGSPMDREVGQAEEVERGLERVREQL